MTDRPSNRTKEEQIYDGLVEVMLEAVSPDPETNKRKPLDAAMTNAIRQFLKDQNIQADPEKHSGLKQLDKNTGEKRPLPFAEAPQRSDLPPHLRT